MSSFVFSRKEKDMPSFVPSTKTVSASTQAVDHGRKVFEIIGYSKMRGTWLLSSGTFNVGGHKWCIRFYPSGYPSEDQACYISVYIELMSLDRVEASCVLSLVDRTKGLSTSVQEIGPTVFEWGTSSAIAPQTSRFMKRSELEARYLQDDNLTIECTVSIMKKPQAVSRFHRRMSHRTLANCCWQQRKVETSVSASEERLSRRTEPCSPCGHRSSRRSSSGR